MAEDEVPAGKTPAAASLLPHSAALDAALERIICSAGSGRLQTGNSAVLQRCERSFELVQFTRVAPDGTSRPDTPDLHVTAVRRLPAQPAEYAPFPAAL